MAPTRSRTSTRLFCVNSLATHAASIRGDGYVQIYSLRNGIETKSFKTDLQGNATSIALGRTENEVGIGSNSGQIIRNEQVVSKIEGDGTIVAWGKTKFVAAGGERREIVDVNEGRRFEMSREHCVNIGAICVSNCERFVIVCSQVITMVNLQDGQIVQRFEGGKGRISHICLQEDGKFITSSKDRVVKVWKTEEGTKKKKKRKKEGVLHTLTAPGDIEAVHCGKGGIVGVMQHGVAVWKEEGECDFVGRGEVLATGIAEGELRWLYAEGLKVRAGRIDIENVEGGEIELIEGREREKEDRDVKVKLVKEARSLEQSGVVAIQGDEVNGEIGSGGEEEEEEGEEEEEETIGEKLKLMGVEVEKRQVGRKEREMSVVGSRAKMLAQAVRGGDMEMLKRELRGGNIKKTVQKMGTEVATGGFLDMLVECLGGGGDVGEWIRQVLIVHAGGVMGGGVLKKLMMVVDERLGGVEDLARLEGRLELIVGRGGVGGGENMAEYVEESGESESGESESEEEETGDSSEEDSSSEEEEEEKMNGVMDSDSDNNSDSESEKSL